MNNVFYLEKTVNGTNQITLKSKLLENRVIYLDQQVNSESVNEVIQQLSLLAISDPGQPVTMLINTPGGSIQDGLVLIDVMQAYDGIINTVSLGVAASMGAVILAAGTRGHRYASKHSQVMLHQPLISGSIPGGNCSEIEEVAKSLLKRKKEIDELLVELTGKSKKEIMQLTSKDNYLTAQKAKDHGLIDQIADGKDLYNLIGGNNI